LERGVGTIGAKMAEIVCKSLEIIVKNLKSPIRFPAPPPKKAQ
jgi:hypothetical protein